MCSNAPSNSLCVAGQDAVERLLPISHATLLAASNSDIHRRGGPFLVFFSGLKKIYFSILPYLHLIFIQHHCVPMKKKTLQLEYYLVLPNFTQFSTEIAVFKSTAPPPHHFIQSNCARMRILVNCKRFLTSVGMGMPMRAMKTPRRRGFFSFLFVCFFIGRRFFFYRPPRYGFPTHEYFYGNAIMRIANPEMSRKRRTKAAPSSISSWQKEKKRKHSTIDSSVPKTKTKTKTLRRSSRDGCAPSNEFQTIRGHQLGYLAVIKEEKLKEIEGKSRSRHETFQRTARPTSRAM